MTFLGIKSEKTIIQKGIYTPMFNAALFTIPLGAQLGVL